MFLRFLPLFSFFVFISSSSQFLSLSETQFNPTRAAKYWDLCMASYCKASKIAAWDLGFVSSAYPQVTDITVVINSTGDAWGYTAYNPQENEVFIVFRGTDPMSIKNWIDDLDTLFTDYPGCEGCSVHEGFYHAYLQLQPRIMDAARELFRRFPNSRKVVTGHSLGGALAVHSALDIIKNFGPIDEFFSYGSPRVGNLAFATFSNGLIKGNFHSRITHGRDPVPHLPLRSWGFYHVDREVFYTVDNTAYTVCNPGEDENCSNSYLAINILDHLSYMGKSMIAYQIECNI